MKNAAHHSRSPLEHATRTCGSGTNPAEPARTLPIVNLEVEAGPTTTKSRNEDDGRRIHTTKTARRGWYLNSKRHWVARNALIVQRGPPPRATGSCARWLEENTTKRVELVSQARTMRCREQRPKCPSAHDNTTLEHHKSQTCLRAAQSATTWRSTEQWKAPAGSRRRRHSLRGESACDETRATNSSTMAEISKTKRQERHCETWRRHERRHDEFEAFEEGLWRTGRWLISCRWEDNNMGDNQRVAARSRLTAREIKQKGTDGYFGGAPLAIVRHVISRADVKRTFLHADALAVTHVKPPHIRDTERCWRLKICMYGTLPAPAGWQHLVQKVGADIGPLSSNIFPCASRDLDMVVHGDDFILAGCGEDLDWLSQKLNENLELKQRTRLGSGYDSEETVLHRCVMYSDTGLTWETDPRHAELAVAELGFQAARPQTSPGGAKPELTTGA